MNVPEKNEMEILLLAAVAGLVALLGVSVYSALFLAKKTDEIIHDSCNDDDSAIPPVVVRFPEHVFRCKGTASDWH